MDHEAAQELFSEYLEGELSPEQQAEVKAHLEGCEECRQELEAFRQTMRALSGLRPLPPPEGFARKVQQRIHRRSRGRFFRADRLFMRVPFEWISFIIIIIMLVLYMLMMETQVKKMKAAAGSGSGRPVPTEQSAPTKKIPTAPPSR